MNRFSSVSPYLLTDFEGTITANARCVRTLMPAAVVTALRVCSCVNMNAKSIGIASCDLELLDAMSVCLMPQHILDTIVDMVTVSSHEVLGLVREVRCVTEVHEVVALTLMAEVVIPHSMVVMLSYHICHHSAECVLLDEDRKPFPIIWQFLNM